MKVEEPWDMLSDTKIKIFLGDINNQMDSDIIRLMLIELFSRLKNLEFDNYTFKALLFESGLVDENLYNESHQSVVEFFKNRDLEKAKEVDKLATMGIPFVEWVNFVTKGKFDT